MAPHALKRRRLDGSYSHEGHFDAAAFLDHQDPTKGDLNKGGGTASNVTDAAGAVEKVDSSGDAEGAARNIYNSNMFKLQVDELLAEMRPDYERKLKKVEKALHKLKAILERIPEQKPLPVSLLFKTYGSRQI